MNAEIPVSGKSSLWKSDGFRGFLLVIGSIVFAWALVELPALLNLVDYETLENSGVWGSLRFHRVPDPVLTHLEPPHAHYTGSSRGGDTANGYQIPPSDQTLFHWDLRYDRNGFRNDTDLDHADIAMIGDSMVEGMTVSHDQVLTTVLQGLSGRSVANLGQYGYGPPQELVVLERYGLQLHPMLVIWLFFEGNDLTDLRNYVAFMKDHAPNSFNFFLQRSFTRLTVHAVGRLFRPPKPAGVKRRGMVSAGGKSIPFYFTYPARDLTPEDLDSIEKTKQIIAEAQRRVAAENGRFLFVFVPEKFRVLQEISQFPLESECGNWKVNDLPAQMRSAIESISPDIGYLDLTESLTAAARKGVLPYYRDDVHWSPEGHRIAAEDINRNLSAPWPARSTR